MLDRLEKVLHVASLPLGSHRFVVKLGRSLRQSVASNAWGRSGYRSFEKPIKIPDIDPGSWTPEFASTPFGARRMLRRAADRKKADQHTTPVLCYHDVFGSYTGMYKTPLVKFFHPVEHRHEDTSKLDLI